VYGRVAFLGVLGLLSCSPAIAQTLKERFVQLVQTQGLAGYEGDVRTAVQAQLPSWANPRVDELGNLILTLGSGEPHLALVASLDEDGYVVSRITDDGFLRLHRPTSGSSTRLADQFMVGQPVVIRTAAGKLVPGVTATPSVHFRKLLDAAETARVKNIQDLWVDLGATSGNQVTATGVRLLDPVSLRQRAQPLAGGRVAGVAAGYRAGAQVLAEVLRAFPNQPTVNGTLTIAWLTQSRFGSRGLVRLAQEIHPQRAYLLGPVAPGPTAPAGWEKTTIEVKSVPVLFADTPVEVVDIRDIRTMAVEIAAAAGLTLPRSTDEVFSRVELTRGPPTAEPSSKSFATLKVLIESYGVSGNEGHVRDAVLKLLPAWAKPQTDEKGNVTISFGSGGKELLFVAHLDEVGFRLSAIRDDGSAKLEARGAMYLSLYEAHPALVHTPAGPIPAIVTPRDGYATASTAQPDLEALSVYFGTTTAAETRALGVSTGQSASVPKQFVELIPPRATARSMDDRVGSTALLLALKRLDPGKIKNRVTFAWSVEEETGLAGASFLAKRLRPAYAFAVDTFVSSATPVDLPYLAHAPLGAGAVLRALDNRTIVPPPVVDRLMSLARAGHVPLQLGATQGSVDASTFSAGGAIDATLSWPGRYSHSAVEVVDRRDLESLATLVATLAERF